MKQKYLLLLFILLLPYCILAQQRSTETVRINGQQYYMHAIKDGETIAKIADVYGVSPADIEAANPAVALSGKLKPGMRLRIPNLDDITKDYPLWQWDFVYYQVKSKIKLKDIAKQYHVDVKDIKKNNPGVDSKPAMLSKIRIPVKKGSAEAYYAQNQPDDKKSDNKQPDNKSNTTSDNPATKFEWGAPSGPEPKSQDNPVKPDKLCKKQNYDPEKSSYTITFLLPLNLNENPKKDFYCISFLEGALLAIEQLKNEGFSAKIIIKDTYDKNSLTAALNDEAVAKSDLIIGPFTVNMLKMTSDFSKKNNIPMVSPYEPKSEVIARNNPYFFQVYPNEQSIVRTLIKDDEWNKNNSNPVLVYPNDPDTTFLSIYRRALSTKFDKYTDYVHHIGQNSWKSKSALAAVLNKSLQNLLYVVSNDEAFVSDLLDRLMMMKAANYPITLYGTQHWRNDFKMANLANYYALNLHIAQPFYIDYDDENIKSFIRNYRATYNSEPVHLAFQGYDVSYYFLSALKEYGSDFYDCLKDFTKPLLQSKLQFEKLYGDDGGYVNVNSFLLKYTPDMTIIKD